MPDDSEVCDDLPSKTFIIRLNRYQRDNLLWLLSAIGYAGSVPIEPFHLANTGDWLGELCNMLSQDGRFHPEKTDVSNISHALLRERIEKWLNKKRKTP